MNVKTIKILLFSLKEKKKKYDINPTPKEFLFPVKKYWKHYSKNEHNYVSEIHPFQFLGLKKFHYFYNENDKAVQFCKIIRKGKNWEALHDNIYDGIFYPLIKALNSQLKYVQKISGEWKFIYLFFPIVVLNSEIYSIQSYNTDKNPMIVESISFIRDLKSKSISGQFLVDFVNKRNLKTFINDRILKFCDQLIKDYKNNPKKYLKKDVK